MRRVKRFQVGLVVGLVVGGGIGFALARLGATATMAELVVQAFIEILDEHGPVVALLITLTAFLIFITWSSINRLIDSKDEEIDRLVEEKKSWQEKVVGPLPSSSASSPGTPAPKRDEENN